MSQELDLVLKDNVINSCKNAIMITGSARSGTTILGKIIHSMENVEYSFEPPFLLGLFSKINAIDEDSWKFFYQNYLYEDFFLNSISGRNLNFNKNDDSSIYKVKSKLEIEKRINGKFRKESLEKLAKNHLIAYKLPSLVPFIAQFSNYFPSNRIIYLKRNPIDCLNSLIDKEWFSDNSLEYTNRIWPIYRIKGRVIPFWVDKEDFDLWIKMDEFNRNAYYFIKMSTNISLANVYQLDYDDLLEKPDNTINELSKELDVKFGEKTNSLINTIKKTKKDRDLKVLNELIPELKDKFNSFI